MSKLFGYGEDGFTLWTLKKRVSEILIKLNDMTKPSDSLIFFRPSFGRSSGRGSAEFGEFDAILASLENIYLIESKWDNFSKNGNDEIKLNDEQILRHKIFLWYYMNWDAQQSDWKFSNDQQKDFVSNFPDRKTAPSGSLLAQNLEFVLKKLQEHCKRCEHRYPRNVLLYFYNKENSKEIKNVIAGNVKFEVINIDYSQYIQDNFIILD